MEFQLDQYTQDCQLVQSEIITEIATYPQWLNKAIAVYTQFIKDNPQAEYREYQYQLAAIYATRPHNICGGSMGLGKTLITGLLIATVYTHLSRPGQIQIAAPSLLSASSRWLIDLQKIAALKGEVEVINTEKQMLTSSAPIWIYTLDFIKRKSKTLAKTSRPYISRLIKKRHLTPSLLVVDEAHLLKKKTDRTKHWEYITHLAKRVLFISGTLSDGRLDLVELLCGLTYHSNFPYSNGGLANEFNSRKQIKTNYAGGGDEIITTTTRYLPDLLCTRIPRYSKLARKFIHRVRLTDPGIKESVFIPQQKDNPCVILPHPSHRKLYRDYLLQAKSELEKLERIASINTNTALSILTPLIKLSSLPPIDVPNHKLDKCATLISEAIALNQKTAIFVSYVETGRFLHEYFARLYPHHNVIRLYAQDPDASPKSMSADMREHAVSEFLFNPDTLIGIFSINLSAESIDLNSAGQVIFYDLPWQALKLQQAIHRVVRPGSPHKAITVNYLVNHGMIDQHKYTLLAEKLKTASALLDFEPDGLNQDHLALVNYRKLTKETLNYLNQP